MQPEMQKEGQSIRQGGEEGAQDGSTYVCDHYAVDGGEVRDEGEKSGGS